MSKSVGLDRSMPSAKEVNKKFQGNSDPFQDGLPEYQPALDNRGNSFEGTHDIDVEMNMVENFGLWAAHILELEEAQATEFAASLVTLCLEEPDFDLIKTIRHKFEAAGHFAFEEEMSEAMDQALDKAKSQAYSSDAKEATAKIRDVAMFFLQAGRSDYDDMGGYEVGVLKLQNYSAGPLKREFRIHNKAHGEKQGIDGEGRYDDILDYGRGRIYAQTAEEVGLLCAAIECCFIMDVELPYGARIIDVENRFEKPTPNGHRALKANIAIPLENSARPYHIIELQVQHEAFEKEIEAKKTAMNNKYGLTSHSGYERRQYMRGRFNDPDDYHNDPDVPISWGPEITKLYGQVIRICHQIHNDASAKYGLDNIDFDRYYEFRESKHFASLENHRPEEGVSSNRQGRSRLKEVLSPDPD